jgi:hypothetical protein
MRDIRMARNVLGIAALVAAISVGAGCAKEPTSVAVVVNTDATAPPILILRSTLVSAGDPTRASSGERSSPYDSDAADRPGPFLFPLLLAVSVDASFAGPVEITIEGLDWDTHAVTARGTTSGSVAAEKTTQASLTLTAVAPVGGDGGTD